MATPRRLATAAIETAARPPASAMATAATTWSKLRRALAALDDEGITVLDLDLSRPTLDDVFPSLTGATAGPP